MTVGYEATAETTGPEATVAVAPEPAKRKSGRLGTIVKLAITVVITVVVVWQAGLTDALRAVAGAAA